MTSDYAIAKETASVRKFSHRLAIRQELGPRCSPTFHLIQVLCFRRKSGSTQLTSKALFITLIILAAGGEKTLVIFGLNFRNARNALLGGTDRDDEFERLWTRHGIYRVDADGSIHPSGLSALAVAAIIERTKITGLLKELATLAEASGRRTRVLNLVASAQEWIDAMGPEWEKKIQSQTLAFAEMVDYLRKRRVNLVAVRMPAEPWDDIFPYERTYFHAMRNICESKSVPIHDLSRLLDYDDFADSIHLNPVGIEKFQNAVMGIALDHLSGTGAVPSNYVEAKTRSRLAE